MFFKKQTVEEIKNAIDVFESSDITWNPHMIRENTKRFCKERFQDEFQGLVERRWEEFISFTDS